MLTKTQKIITIPRTPEPIEIEDMETLWGDMSLEFKKQKKLTELVLFHTIQDYNRKKLIKLFIPEVISAVICFTGGLLVLFNLQILNTWPLFACGIISSMLLFILPIISIKAIREMKSLVIINEDYAQSLIDYSKGKIKFVFAQRLNLYLSFFLILFVPPVFCKITSGKDIFFENINWIVFTLVGAIYLSVFSRWLYFTYRKAIVESKTFLKERELKSIPARLCI